MLDFAESSHAEVGVPETKMNEKVEIVLESTEGEFSVSGGAIFCGRRVDLFYEGALDLLPSTRGLQARERIAGVAVGGYVSLHSEWAGEVSFSRREVRGHSQVADCGLVWVPQSEGVYHLDGETRNAPANNAHAVIV